MVDSRKLDAVAPPSLINAPSEYSTNHFNQYSNVLRLYFNRLSWTLRALLGANGGKNIAFPHIAASDSTIQYAGGNNVATKVLWDTLETSSGFVLNPTASATAEQSGIYKIDYSLEFVNTVNSAQDITVWLKVNGSDVPRSGSKFTIPARKSAIVYSYLVAYSSLTFSMNADDYVELWWETTLAYNPVGPVNGVYMEAQAATGSLPAIPSAVGTIAFVSAIP